MSFEEHSQCNSQRAEIISEAVFQNLAFLYKKFQYITKTNVECMNEIKPCIKVVCLQCCEPQVHFLILALHSLLQLWQGLYSVNYS